MESIMDKSFSAFIGGICTGAILIMLYFHRNVIKAAITGEEMPKTPKNCPVYKPEEDDE